MISIKALNVNIESIRIQIIRKYYRKRYKADGL